MALVIPQHGTTCPECGAAVIRTRCELDGRRYRVCSGKGSCGSVWLLPKIGTSAPKPAAVGSEALLHVRVTRPR